MFFDADQDLAHEFYEEVAVQLSDGRIRLKMRRIKHNLKPQVCPYRSVGCRQEKALLRWNKVCYS